MTKHSYFILALFLLAMVSCRKDEDTEITTTPTTNYKVKQVNIDFEVFSKLAHKNSYR